jgi:GntR family transcriptional regulator of vanillate catabolism
MEKRLKAGQHVIVSLRRMIAVGEFKDGERIGEIATAELLGVSRMPVRTALRALEQEGLVVKLGGRGYAARSVTATQIKAAIEVRGVLEGLSARLIAERGLEPREDVILVKILETGDLLFEKGYLVDGDLERYHDYNIQFHDFLVEACRNQAIRIALTRNNHLPFASASALFFEWNDPFEYRRLRSAHRQHYLVVDAIRRADAEEAERAMRAHASAAIGSIGRFERLGIERGTTAVHSQAADY